MMEKRWDVKPRGENIKMSRMGPMEGGYATLANQPGLRYDVGARQEYDVKKRHLSDSNTRGQSPTAGS